MVDSKTLIEKCATETELNRVKDAMRRGEKNTTPEQTRPILVKLSNKLGLTFKKIIFPIELRKKIMVTLHFSHNGTTKMLAETRQF